jgi:hypothetical protein
MGLARIIPKNSLPLVLLRVLARCAGVWQFTLIGGVGDLATDNDAARLARSQAPVKPITTGTLCPRVVCL